MKWALLTRSDYNERYEVLSEILSAQGIKNELEIIQVNESNYPENLAEAKLKFDALRIGGSLGDSIKTVETHLSSDINYIGAADCYVKADGVWYPRNSFMTAVKTIISEQSEVLDRRFAALIIGTGALARTCLAALVKAGYTEVNFSSHFEEEGTKFVESLTNTYFNVKINFIAQEKLILFSGMHSVMVNTVIADKMDRTLLEELFYFNFLKSYGSVWDISLFKNETKLLTEARNIQAHIVDGKDFAKYQDQRWLSLTFDAELDMQKYLSLMADKLPQFIE